MPAFASTDSPKNSVPIKNHRYQIPRYPLQGPMPSVAEPLAGTGMLVPWTRMSTIVETHEDKEGIRKWRERLIIKGIGARADLYALAASTRLEEKFQLSDIATQAFDYARGQAASNTGTALHGFLERHAKGELDAADIPEPWRSDVAAVLTAFQDAGIRVVPHLQEMVVVRPDLKDGDSNGLAGRLDLMVEIYNPDTKVWELIMVDYKTGSDPLAYGAWKIQQQLGGYTTAWATWDGEFWRPMPPVVRDRVLMVHVLPGQASVQIHQGRIDPDELEADLAAAYRTRRRRKEAKNAWSPLVTVEDGSLVGTESDDPRVPALSPAAPTPDAAAQQAKAAERLAVVDSMAKAAGRNDDPDDEGPGEPAPAAILNGDGKPLMPLAGPGERGCGVCGRKGHRKGGKACLGTLDPRANGQDRLSEDEWAITPHPAGGHSWTRNPIDGGWSCAIGGEAAAPKVAATLTEHQERPGQTTETVEDFPGQVTPAELAAERSEAEQAETAGTAEPDPFDDDEDSAAEADWHLFLDRINEAKDKAEIRDIRKEATELGVWDDQLLQAGLARIKTFK